MWEDLSPQQWYSLLVLWLLRLVDMVIRCLRFRLFFFSALQYSYSQKKYNTKQSDMAHIDLPKGVPGMRSLVMFRPDTGKHLYALAQVLLRGDSPLTPAERELIATH